MSFGGGNSGGGQTIAKTDPYDPAKPALNQILSEAGNLYGQGVKAAGYVAPSAQTTRGLAAQELMGTAATQQLSDTLSGKYLNPFLSPLLQGAGNEIATAINTEFSGAGRTPGSPMNQQQIAQLWQNMGRPQTLQEADKFIKASKNYELLTMEE